MENDPLETTHELWRMLTGESSTARLDQSLYMDKGGLIVHGFSSESIGIDTAMGQVV